jgi:hypothetical protein
MTKAILRRVRQAIRETDYDLAITLLIDDLAPACGDPPARLALHALRCAERARDPDERAGEIARAVACLCVAQGEGFEEQTALARLATRKRGWRHDA